MKKTNPSPPGKSAVSNRFTSGFPLKEGWLLIGFLFFAILCVLAFAIFIPAPAAAPVPVQTTAIQENEVFPRLPERQLTPEMLINKSREERLRDLRRPDDIPVTKVVSFDRKVLEYDFEKKEEAIEYVKTRKQAIDEQSVPLSANLELLLESRHDDAFEDVYLQMQRVLRNKGDLVEILEMEAEVKTPDDWTQFRSHLADILNSYETSLSDIHNEWMKIEQSFGPHKKVSP